MTLLGSILSNLLFVFGLSCLVGGMQWQVQELRITSGNASIGMLLTATMGMVLPAALKMMNHQNMVVQTDDQGMTTTNDLNDQEPPLTENDVAFSRFNSVVMMVGYISYMIFQLGSHKNEFDCNSDEYISVGGGHDDDIVPIASSKYKRKRKSPTRPNLFCKKYCFIMNKCPRTSENEYGASTKNALCYLKCSTTDLFIIKRFCYTGIGAACCIDFSTNGIDLACNHHHVNFDNERRNR